MPGMIITLIVMLHLSAWGQGTNLSVPTSFEELREAMIERFLGPPAFNSTLKLDIEDQLYEIMRESQCRDVTTIRRFALDIFSRSQFFQEDYDRSSSRKFPEYSIHLVRQLAGPPAYLDVVVFYFTEEKVGPHCAYRLGVLGQRERLPDHTVVRDERHDAFFNEVTGKIEEISRAL